MSHIVLHGIDTIKVNVKLLQNGQPAPKQELPIKFVEQLEAWQQEAKEEGEPVRTAWSFHNARFVMFPNGAQAWKYIIRNECLEIKLVPRLHMAMVAKVTFQSYYLWHIGSVKAALADVETFFTELLGDAPFLQAGQLDLCVDMTDLGEKQTLPIEWEKVFISHSLVKKPIGISKKDTAYYLGRELETIIFSGHGTPVNGKLYNKTREIQKHQDKQWFSLLWQRQGWDGKADVWRMEFSLERQGLHEMDIERIDDALANLKRLWVYCSYEWLRMVIPDAQDSNRTRWATHPLWQELQYAFDYEGDSTLDKLGPLIRERKRVANREQLLAQIAGCTTTLIAWHEEEDIPDETDAHDMVLTVALQVLERWRKKGIIPQDEVQAKRFIYSQKP